MKSFLIIDQDHFFMISPQHVHPEDLTFLRKLRVAEAERLPPVQVRNLRVRAKQWWELHSHLSYPVSFTEIVHTRPIEIFTIKK